MDNSKYNKKETLIDELKRLGICDNPEAQFRLGMCYFDGYNKPMDKERAIQLFSLASDKKHPGALTMLGTCRWKGVAVDQDIAVGAQYILEAEKLGDEKAHFNADMLFSSNRKGIFMLSDEEKELSMKAENGDTNAMYNFGRCLLEDVAVHHRDRSEGLKWLYKAAQKGHSLAKLIIFREAGEECSFIYIRCTQNANPKFNRLKLRTTPASYIELQPGDNYLIVDDYPALKYGFSQIDSEEDSIEESISQLREENCQDVVDVDLSYFNGSNMTSMDYMFDYMSNLISITFGNLDTSNVKSMVRAFDLTNIPELKIEFDTSNVKDMSYMLFHASSSFVDLSGLNITKVGSMKGIFLENKISSLNLSSWEVPKACDIEHFYLSQEKLYTGNPSTIIMEGCNTETVDLLSEEIYCTKEDDLVVIK